jgi:hypothetical protein
MAPPMIAPRLSNKAGMPRNVSTLSLSFPQKKANPTKFWLFNGGSHLEKVFLFLANKTPVVCQVIASDAFVQVFLLGMLLIANHAEQQTIFAR